MTGMHVRKRPVTASLRSLLSAAYAADPRDCLIAPVGEHGYSTIFSLIPAALAVLRVAVEIESDPAEVLDWYRSARIAELGNLTAEQLVSIGRAETVIEFLRSIQAGGRN